MLVFAHWELARYQGMDAEVFETVVSATVACDFDAWRGTERHCNKLVDNGNLRVSLVAADDGVGQTEPREGPTLTFIVLRLDG